MTQQRVAGMVSTIIPVHNRAGLLQEAVASVLAQTYRPIEIIVVDDGSTDDTLNTARRLAERHPAEIVVIHQANAGPGAARETGRQQARGEFIQYLDSDDVLLPGKFSAQVSGLRERTDAGVSYCWTRFRHADGTLEPQPWKGSGQRVPTMFPSFLVSRWWDTPTPLYRAEICDRAGPWSDLRLEEDWEYDCRVAALGAALHHAPQFLVEVRDHGGMRLSRSFGLEAQRMAMRAQAHALIFQHMQRARVSPQSTEAEHFSRALFLLSRQCGACGLAKQARDLFSLARQATAQPDRLQFRLYSAASATLGWKTAGKLSCYSDRLRHLRNA